MRIVALTRRRELERREGPHGFEHLVQRTSRHRASRLAAGGSCRSGSAASRSHVADPAAEPSPPARTAAAASIGKRPGSAPRRRNTRCSFGGEQLIAPGDRRVHRLLAFGEIARADGREQDIVVSSRRSRSSTVSTLIHGAASSSASGSASSRRQIAVTVGPFADVRRKSGCTSRTRSTKRRTAGERARSAGDIAPSSTSSASGPTAYSRSPRTRSGARLVTSTRSARDRCQEIRDQRRRVQNLLEIVEHQQRRATVTRGRARVGKSTAVTSGSPSASAIADATNAGFRMAASGTNTTRVGVRSRSRVRSPAPDGSSRRLLGR